MIFLLLILNLFAQEIVIQSNNIPNLNYEKYLLEHPNQISFSDFYLSQNNSNRENLLSILKKAQYEFLNGSI
jgi:predicted nuclease of restriction endonuclease-like RecB superfamily